MKRWKAVILDDEPWTRDVIKSLGNWETYGIDVVGEASDGEYGIEMIRQMGPDIILTDVNMPQLNGIELMENLRKEGNRSLVIYISGYDNYEYIRSALKLDARDYLLKPVKPEELNNQLQQCVRLLGERDMQETENSAIPSGFLEADWAGQYYTLRDGLYDSLNSSDGSIVRQKLEDIHRLIREREGDGISKGNLICVYHTLMNTLQKFIISRDYTAADIFPGQSTIFVFSREASLGEMMDFISALYASAVNTIQELARSRNRLDIRSIQKYAEEHYCEGITLEQTADAFFVSKEYLSKIFKATVGKGFTEYVTALRMGRAKELIVDYKIPIKEVGELVGYLDQAHFYKNFKKFYGITPGEMKEI